MRTRISIAVVLVVLLVVLRSATVGHAQTQQPPPGVTTTTVQRHLATMMPGAYITHGCVAAAPPTATSIALTLCEGVVLSQGQAIPVSQPATTLGPLTGGDGLYWAALHVDTTSTVAGWTRQSGTRYLWAKGTTAPALTAGTVFASVQVTGGAIVAASDFRVPASYVRSGTYDVTDPLYGGVADDTTDIGPALQAAIGAVIAQRGRTVRMPQGTYRLSTPVVVPVGGAVEITGDDWGAPAQELYEGTNQPRRGTWLHITSTGFVPFTLIGTGTTLKNLAFDHDQPAVAPGWAPIDYPYTIVVESPATCCVPQTNNDDMRLQRLFFFKATRGIHQKSVAGWQTSGLFIEQVYGQFFTSGIFVEFSAGFVKLSGIHMWVYWAQDANIYAWLDAHFHAITIWRLDSGLLEDVHLFATASGIELIDNVHGPAQAVQMSNITVDRSRYLFYTNQNGGSAQLTNMLSNGGGYSGTDSLGIHVGGTGNRINVLNYECSNVALYCMAVTSGNVATAANIRTFNTNTLANGTPVFLAQTSAIFVINGLVTTSLTNGSPVYGGVFERILVPSGVQFDASDPYFGATIVGGLPTMSFTLNAFMQWIAGQGFRLNGASGEYVTGGVTKALCIQDGIILVCP